MKVPVKGETTCLKCEGTGVDLLYKWFGQSQPCKECRDGKIPTLTFKEVSAEDQVTEQIKQWYNGR